MTTQNIEILKAKSFEKAVKQLKKRFKNIENELYLLYIYDKSDYENISEKEIDTLILNSVH